MKALNDQLINAKTPEEKKSIQAQIDALAGNVAKGGSKTITYAIIGLVVVVGAYMLFKKKN
jgi:LPXTG-motif cell wall-anchored protein